VLRWPQVGNYANLTAAQGFTARLVECRRLSVELCRFAGNQRKTLAAGTALGSDLRPQL